MSNFFPKRRIWAVEIIGEGCSDWMIESLHSTREEARQEVKHWNDPKMKKWNLPSEQSFKGRVRQYVPAMEEEVKW